MKLVDFVDKLLRIFTGKGMFGFQLDPGTAMLIAGGISAGGGILGGLLGGDDEQEWEPKYLQLPDYAEAEGARGNWWQTLQDWGKPGANYGATDMNWEDIFKSAENKVNQYYWGGVNDTGLAGKIKASAARRNVSQSPALENSLTSLGFQQSQDIGNLFTNLTTQKANYTESARKNWLSSLMNLAGLKPNFVTNAGVSSGSSTYGTGDMIGDISGGVGDLFSQYAKSQQTEDLMTRLLQGYGNQSLSTLTGTLGKVNISPEDWYKNPAAQA